MASFRIFRVNAAPGKARNQISALEPLLIQPSGPLFSIGPPFAFTQTEPDRRLVLVNVGRRQSDVQPQISSSQHER